jgi:hypothetical protein
MCFVMIRLDRSTLLCASYMYGCIYDIYESVEVRSEERKIISEEKKRYLKALCSKKSKSGNF